MSPSAHVKKKSWLAQTGARRENPDSQDTVFSKRVLTKKMTGKEYDAELALLTARLAAAGDDRNSLNKIAEDMLALCDVATISEVPGLGIPKARKPRRIS